MERTGLLSRLASALAARAVPHRFIAAQLAHPSGSFGRWVMTRALNTGNAEIISGTLDALELRPDQSFMDVGFGGGLALRLASKRTRASLWGIDSSPDVVAAGHRLLGDLVAQGRLNLLTGDVSELPLRDALVDAICTTNTIYFWPDPPQALASLKRVLAPRGRLAIGFSGADKMRDFDPITRHGFRLYEEKEVRGLLERAGFEEVTLVAQTGSTSSGDFVAAAVRPAR